MTSAAREQSPLLDLESLTAVPASSNLASEGRQSSVSIFEASAIDELEAIAGKKTVETITKTQLGLAVQLGVFLVLALTTGLTPCFNQLVLWDSATQTKIIGFIPQTPYVVEYALSAILGNLFTLIFFGKEGIKQAWSAASMTDFMPSAFCYGISEAIEFDTMKHLDSSSILILRQLKLPAVALIRYLLFSQKQTLTQSALIVIIPVAVYGYVTTNSTQAAGVVFQGITTIGLVLALVNVALSITCSLTAEWGFRRNTGRYIIQVATLRFLTFLVMSVTCVFCVWMNNDWHLWFFGGWNWSVFAICLWLQMKDFLTLFIIKHLNTFWMALATSAGLCIAYVSDIIVFSKPFNQPTCVFIILISLLVLTYALTKRPIKTPT